jgi:hypothetical protein
VAALVPALILLCWVPFVQVLVYRRVAMERDACSLLQRELEHENEADLPILVANATDYLQLHHKAPKPLASRLHFPRDAAMSRVESSSAGEIERLGHWVDLSIDNLASIRQACPQFLVFGSSSSGLVKRLEAPGSGAMVIARGPELFLVQKAY